MDLQSPPKPPAGLYTPFTRKSSIRLLHFSHASSDVDLHFELESFCLDEIPDYRAISYVWGEPYLNQSDAEVDMRLNFNRQIYCNRLPVGITLNAFALLKQMSKLLPQSYLWLDCVCIDQSNLEERSEQVLLIKDVYSKATEVIAWLGHSHDLLEDFEWASTTFKAAIERTCGELGSEGSTRPSPVPTVLGETGFWKSFGLPYSYSRLKRATTFSAICRWFNRSWIVQEAVLAKRVNLLCGSTWLSWEGVVWLGIMFSTPWREIARDHSMPGWVQFMPSLGYRAWEYNMHRNSLITILDEDTNAVPTSGIQRFLIDFLRLLKEFRATECSDGRDKVYALLGLAYYQHEKRNRDSKLKEDLIPVNYEKYTTSDIYRHLAILALEHLDSLYLLSFVEAQVLSSIPNLPSWAPDFTVTFGGLFLPSLAPSEDRMFRVWGQSYPYVHRPEVSGKELKLWGTKIDTIDGDLGAFGGPIRDYKGLKSLSGLHLCLPDVHREPSMTRVAALMWTALRRDPDHLGDQSGNSLESITLGFHNLLLSNIAAELWYAGTQGQEVEAAHCKQVETLLSQFQPEIKAGEVPSIESILKFKDLIATRNSTSAPTSSKKSATKKFFDYQVSQAAYFHFAERGLKGRQLSRTKQGVLGLFPLGIEEDDEIWMLHGGDVPFVLQPYFDKYRLVGDCYLHGYMHGEKLEEDPNLADKIQPIVLV